jgi:YXWGXW repeat-containing protein
MSKTIVLATLAAALTVTPVQASNVGVDLNVRIGNQPPAVAVPVPAPAPVVVVEEPPLFLYPQGLGFYVAVGIPYDLFYIDNRYYLFRGNVWHSAPHYNGPWVVVKHKHLPPGLRRHRIERIRVVRDDEFRVYDRDRRHFSGKYYRPDKEWKEERKEEHERRKEERGHGNGNRGRHGDRD